MKICPHCFSTRRKRRKRYGWKALIPLARYYQCTRCEGTYLYIELFEAVFKVNKPEKKRGDL